VLFSSTFYEQLFSTKVFFEAFLYLQFGFVIFWQKNIVKLTTGINILQAAFAPLDLR